MAMSQAETIGFADQFRQFLLDNKNELEAKGLDVSAWITDTENLKNSAVVELGKQDDMQAALKAQTKVAEAAVDLLYDTTSSRLDASIGVLGKKTPLAKQAGKLRSNLIRQHKKSGADGGENT